MLPWTLPLALAAVAIATGAAAPAPTLAPSTSLLKLDISPEEAAQYLASPPFSSPALAPRIESRPLLRWDSPQFRAADAGPTRGHYWRDGHEIQNTDDYVEDVYRAAQFHGQDGLGAYKYGYSAPESAKVEDRARTGRVEGAYTYVGGPGGPPQVEVRYWADHDGFHQQDNLPKVELQPAQETEEVRRARIEHERAWHQAADAALHPNAQTQYAQYAGAASAPQASYATSGYRTPDAGAGSAREGKAFYNQQYQQQVPAQAETKAVYDQRYQQQAPTQAETKSYYGQQYPTQGSEAEPEPTGPPRGFFYSFDYPVSIIVPKNEAAAAERGHA